MEAGVGATIEGSGSPTDPWVVSVTGFPQGALQVADTQTIDLDMRGAGTTADPYVITGKTSSLPGGISTGHGITGDGSGLAPLRLDVCTYDDLLALKACAP